MILASRKEIYGRLGDPIKPEAQGRDEQKAEG
jgi:hypothetical protein